MECYATIVLKNFVVGNRKCLGDCKHSDKKTNLESFLKVQYYNILINDRKIFTISDNYNV